MNLDTIGEKIDDIEVSISHRIIELFSAGLYSSPNKAFESQGIKKFVENWRVHKTTREC